MRNGRIRFWRTLQKAGGERVRLMYPHVDDGKAGTETMIHSKVMVIDDNFLRIGSANMNNRSMGADSECDLAIEAKTRKDRRAIVELRNRLIGEHCGVPPAAVARALKAKRNSLTAVADSLSANGHSLRPIDDGVPDDGEVAGAIEELADPKRPIRLSNLWRNLLQRGFAIGGRTALVIVLALLVGALTVAWYLTPLAEWADPDAVRDWF